ncbi:hypothetical protein [Amnibacterium sp.]|uniref:hypothetical protein n=1 Tax=Amnibacterium sp. TaxID=1872496 RepID=UPI0026143FCD|nr:hypothetical protein [Amnibacterium sp.]MCU1472223.1 hypothetical protein [Amnibacterium sp.]
MPTLLRNQDIHGGTLELGRMSMILACSLTAVTVLALEGDVQLAGSTFRDCDLRKVPARAIQDCRLISCRLPSSLDAGRNRVEAPLVQSARSLRPRFE